MSEFSSYYLYQRYEKRGNQDWIPCVPNIYSITGDSTNPMSASAKSECDPQCGCSTVQYRWVNIDPSIDWICDGTSKYYKQRREVSYDGGTTWIPLDEYQKGSLIEASSSDCTSPTPTLYRWVQTEDTVCVENANSTYTKYYVYKKQQQVNGQWTDVSPAETKPDGYPLGIYDTLAQCQGLEPQYRWYPSGYTCVGYDKWEQSVKQESYDGETWETVIPVETSATTLIEINSEYCGYVPPTPTGATKFRATYAGGTTYELECDDNTTLTSGNTKPSGYQYTAMTDAVIGDCVTEIDYYALGYCSSLTSCTIGSAVTVIDNCAFWDCTSLTSIVIPNSVITIGDYAFENCSGLTSCTIGSSVTSIGAESFFNCRSLTSIVIPDNVVSIDTNAFSGCTGLTTVTLGSGLTSIGHSAFEYCKSITSIDIPDSVTEIGIEAFYGCSGITSATIGTGVTSIGTSAFTHCRSLVQIIIYATTPPTLGNSVFYDNASGFKIYVPSASLNAYKSANRWSNYANIIYPI